MTLRGRTNQGARSRSGLRSNTMEAVSVVVLLFLLIESRIGLQPNLKETLHVGRTTVLVQSHRAAPVFPKERPMGCDSTEEMHTFRSSPASLLGGALLSALCHVPSYTAWCDAARGSSFYLSK